ncbi:MAG: Uncharacterised protein [Hyphomonas sp. TMED17]|nr:MAG: Uncharacterised protein [Hyphomonas sp. TMED17]
MAPLIVFDDADKICQLAVAEQIGYGVPARSGPDAGGVGRCPASKFLNRNNCPPCNIAGKVGRCRAEHLGSKSGVYAIGANQNITMKCAPVGELGCGRPIILAGLRKRCVELDAVASSLTKCFGQAVNKVGAMDMDIARMPAFRPLFGNRHFKNLAAGASELHFECTRLKSAADNLVGETETGKDFHTIWADLDSGSDPRNVL